MKRIPLILLTLVLLTSCGKKYSVPSSSVDYAAKATTYPDYNDVTIPPNIAPLNFRLIEEGAKKVVVEYRGKSTELVSGAGKDLKVRTDTAEWRSLLSANKGGDITVTVYALVGKQWRKYRSHTLTVAEEDIDPYLSYRLIEPGYEVYRQLGLYQRNLTNWTEKPIYENNRVYNDDDNHCVNCHNFQAGSTRRMLFHVRAKHGGTVFVEDGEARKIQFHNDSLLSAGVYPSWHPRLNLVAFSTNITAQNFHIIGREKIEVYDDKSDLILYDADRNEVSTILNSPTQLETFPCWAPEGDYLYYCSADEPYDTSLPDSLKGRLFQQHYKDFLYDVMRLPFDEQTGRFGEPEVVVDCHSRHRSASFPRVSPDGRYVLFAEGDYGQFHIWHVSSDLFVKDLQTDSVYALREANSPDVDSFHSWSSNGRWIAFSSRRIDGNYTRPFITYFDKEGHAHKAFCIPQEDPDHDLLLLKSYNVPELTRDAVSISESDLRRCIYDTEGTEATFVSRKE